MTKRIGIFLSFGIGGADKTLYNLVKGTREIDPKNLEFVYFYNQWSLPNHRLPLEKQTEPCGYEKYIKMGVSPILVEDVAGFNEYNLDLFVVSRGGDENWLLPNFEQTEFNFKVLEINFHGCLQTKADHRVFPSNALTSFKNLYSLPHSVIYNPVLPAFSSDASLREMLRLENRFVYGRVGRNSEDIYSPIILFSYKQVESPDTAFLYINPSPKAVEDANRLGLSTVIFCSPTMDDEVLSKIYNTMDVFCHSNAKGETFGNGIAEAMMHGLPIVSHPGVCDWTQAQLELIGLSGHVDQYITTVPHPLDEYTPPKIKAYKEWAKAIIPAYAKQMQRLKDDVNYYKSVSTANLETAIQNFHYLKVCQKYINLFVLLLSK